MKKQTLILVMIGVILFIAGSAIAFASVEGASKHTGSGTNVVAPVSTSAVVAKANIPAGTTGQSMISSGLVAIELIPTKSYTPTDLGSLSGLTDQVLTTAVTKGNAISSTELKASTSSISLPTGMDAMTITLTGANGLAGYLQPGSHVDVYGNVTKLSGGLPDSGPPQVPCTELLAPNIEVLDVQSTVPAYSAKPNSTARQVPASETLLLAVNPNQSRTIAFMSLNQTVSVVQTQARAVPPAVGQCVGTTQLAVAP